MLLPRDIFDSGSAPCLCLLSAGYALGSRPRDRSFKDQRQEHRRGHPRQEQGNILPADLRENGHYFPGY